MHSQCPTADELALLLRDELSQAERTFLEAHLEGCIACREKLNVLADGGASRVATVIEPDTPEFKASLARLKPEESGDRLGPYKLLQQIGEGGFGAVWMAEQLEPVKRRVALKIIKLGMDTKEVIARFEQERQALAMMDHPNIAKVFDAGATQWGRPFFVMELVRGMPITEYCDEQKLGVRERVSLFIEVCQAVQHAHQKGIIHRDLKPSNILISTGDDHEPIPKIIDFGVAKAMDRTLTEKTLFTQFEQMIGTPTYMSPEQAGVGSMDIDTRSDIYSLGVLLYELLTGKPPFDPDELRKVGHDEMRRVIREEEPPRPSTRLSTLQDVDLKAVATHRHADAAKLASTVRGDLDWIVMKALEKNRNRRYETANGLAMDLRRHLGHEPVLARPPTFRYKFGKFIGKHKGPVAAAVALLMVLIGGLTASTVLFLREKAAWRSEAAQRAAAQQHAQAEAAARQDAESVSTFLRDHFRSPSRRGSGAATAAKFADKVKALELELADQPARRARLQEMVAAIYYSTERHRDAIPLQEKVKEYYVKTLGAEHRESLEAMNALAILYAADGRRDEAEKLWNTVIAVRQNALAVNRTASGSESRETLAPLTDLARSYAAAGRREEAIKTWEALLALSRTVSGESHHETFSVMNELAGAHEAAGRNGEAQKIWEELLALRRASLPPGHPETLRLMADLANFYGFSGERDKVIKLWEEILTIRQNTLGRENPTTIDSMLMLALYYRIADRYDEALKLSEETVPLSRKVNGPEHADTIRAMSDLASSYSRKGRKDEAAKLQEDVLQLRRKVDGPEHQNTLREMTSLALAYSVAGRKEEALKLREEALAIHRKTPALENREVLSLMTSVLDQYFFAGRRDEALKLSEELLPLQRKLYGAHHSSTRTVIETMIRRYQFFGFEEKSVPLMLEISEMKPSDSIYALSVVILQAWFGKKTDHAENCRRIIGLAESSTDTSTADRAAKGYCLLPSSDPQLLKAALGLARRAVDLGKDHQYFPYYEMSLGMAEYRNGNYKAAAELLVAAEREEKAHRHVRETAPFFHAMSLFRQGKQSEARKRFSEAVAQMRPLPADERHPLADKAEADDIIVWLAYKEAKALLAE